MVYKHKNNKWSRIIAARKLAAANRENSAAAQSTPPPPKEVTKQQSAEPSCDGAHETRDTTEAGQCDSRSAPDINANTPAAELDQKQGHKDTPHTTAEGTKDASVSLSTDPPPRVMPARLMTPPKQHAEKMMLSAEATVTPSYTEMCAAVDDSTVDLPRVLDVFSLPSLPFVAYAMCSDAGDAAVMVCGVRRVTAKHDNANDSGDDDAADGCLQIVRWRTPSTAGGEALPVSKEKAEPLREVMMYVDDAGQCFMLTPSSTVSVVHVDGTASHAKPKTQEDTNARAETVSGGGATCPPGVEAVAAADQSTADRYAYWVIPTMLKQHFLALLQAQREWKKKQKGSGAAHSSSSSDEESSTHVPCANVCPHHTLWAASQPKEGTDHKDIVAVNCVAEQVPPAMEGPANATTKTKAKKGKAKKRVREATPLPAPQAQPEAVTEVPAVAPEPVCRLPYVARAVRVVKAEQESAAQSEAAAEVPYPECAARDMDEAARRSCCAPTWTLYVGNRLTPFPSDYHSPE